MNTQGFNILPNRHFHVEQNQVGDERKIRAMEEEIEVLREQVESLKRGQQLGYELAYECLQEREYTNKELDLMNEEISNLINLKRLPMDQAQQWAKSISQKNAFASDALSELLNAIYRYPVNLNEGEKIETPILRSEVEQSKVQSREIRAKSEQLIARSSKITARSHEIRVCSRAAKAHSREIRNQLSNDKVSSTASKILNLSDALAPWGERELGA